jgi:hypothetical protein
MCHAWLLLLLPALASGEARRDRRDADQGGTASLLDFGSAEVGGQRALFDEIDADASGTLSRAELAAERERKTTSRHIERSLEAYDTEGDGQLDREDLRVAAPPSLFRAPHQSQEFVVALEDLLTDNFLAPESVKPSGEVIRVMADDELARVDRMPPARAAGEEAADVGSTEVNRWITAANNHVTAMSTARAGLAAVEDPRAVVESGHLRNEDVVVTIAETDALFDEIDADTSGTLSRVELAAMLAGTLTSRARSENDAELA